MTVHPIDIHVGAAIRVRRRALGLTQVQLAEACGVRFQQVQKYETGANRVSASRMFQIAAALGLPVRALFEGVEGGDVTDALRAATDVEAHLLRNFRRCSGAGQRVVADAARNIARAAPATVEDAA